MPKIRGGGAHEPSADQGGRLSPPGHQPTPSFGWEVVLWALMPYPGEWPFLSRLLLFVAPLIRVSLNSAL